MNHKTLVSILRPLALPSSEQVAAAAQDKLNRRPTGISKAGFLKASGKWSPSRVAAMRKINVRIAARMP